MSAVARRAAARAAQLPEPAGSRLNILGIVTKAHDTGAAILSNGLIKAVMEEERFNRHKHTHFFPTHALEAALESTGLKMADIDAVTTPWDIKQLRHSFRQVLFRHAPASFNLARPASNPAQMRGIIFLRQRLTRELRKRLNASQTLPPIIEVPHHDAHAAIFFQSPFDQAAVLVMDGYGDRAATSMYTGQASTLTQHWQSEFFDSIGSFYSCVTTYLGFKILEEGTVMALAACGGPSRVADLRKLVKVNPDGSFRFNHDYLSFHTHGLIRPFTHKFCSEFGPPRLPGEPLEDRHRDIAAALQIVTEEIVVNLARAIGERTSSTNLCISGGVGLNCVANAKVLEKTKFKRVWVPPCASDTGVPLGSALYYYHHTLGKPRTSVMTHAFYGAEYTEREIEDALQEVGLRSTRLADHALFERVAADLAAMKIVGCFQGRHEIGPRALGNRSILADPRSLKIKTFLNARIKAREPFRPFAPAVLADRATEFFEISQPDPFMTLAPRVHKNRVDDIPAAVHVDGTGRIQTVDRDANPRFYRLIEAFGRLTGIPVLLNTSFNRQEPIVATPAHAISCYLRTRMDVLMLGNHYVTDRTPEAEARAEAAHKAQGEALAKRLAGWSIFES